MFLRKNLRQPRIEPGSDACSACEAHHATSLEGIHSTTKILAHRGFRLHSFYRSSLDLFTHLHFYKVKQEI